MPNNLNLAFFKVKIWLSQFGIFGIIFTSLAVKLYWRAPLLQSPETHQICSKLNPDSSQEWFNHSWLESGL